MSIDIGQRGPRPDFTHDRLWHGHTFRILNVIDDYNPLVLRIETDTSLPALRVIRVLEQLEEEAGVFQR